MTAPTFAILFVCLGNICRSPLAEGAFRDAAARAGLADRFRIDSAGLAGYHTGAPPDRRSIQVAARHGFDISGLRARPVTAADFTGFDLILGMDRDNHAGLLARRPASATAEVGLYRQWTEGAAKSVPDPYYGAMADFEAVFDLVERGSRALLAQLPPRRTHV